MTKPGSVSSKKCPKTMLIWRKPPVQTPILLGDAGNGLSTVVFDSARNRDCTGYLRLYVY